MEHPLVSVCILTCNHARYISDCIMSAVSQANDVSLEILVGDDRSDDGTSDTVRKLAEKFPELIRHFRHENRNVGKNYQFLLGQAVGKYIAHLDGDDYWLPGKLARQIHVMEEINDVSACYTNALCVDDAGELIGLFNNKQPARIDLNYLLARGNFLNNTTAVYRAKFKKFFIERSPEYIDYEIHLYLARQGELAYLNVVGAGYRVRSGSSLILNQGEFVRDHYWHAICSVPDYHCSAGVKLMAQADFLRRVFFKALRLRSLAMLLKWWVLVSAKQNRKIKLLFSATALIVVTGSREIVEFLASTASKSTVRIFYRR